MEMEQSDEARNRATSAGDLPMSDGMAKKRIRTRSDRRGRDDGVALVEFAIVAPLLFLLIFGIIEFGYAFFQNLDVRHGARETARVAAVNFGGEDPSCTAGDSAACNDSRLAAIVTEACDRMSNDDDVIVHIMREDGPDSNISNFDVGDSAVVFVEKPLEQITMFLDPFLSGIDLSSRVEIRLEQPAQWTAMPDANDDGRSESPLSC